MTQSDKIQMNESKKGNPDNNFNEKEIGSEKINNHEQKVENCQQEYDVFTESIKVPRIIVPCIQILARFTHQTVDEFLTQLVVIGLADVYQEPEQMVYAMKDQKELFKRFKHMFDKNVVDEHDFEGNPKQEKQKKNTKVEEITVRMKIPETLLKCIKIYTKITDRTQQDLLATLIINHLYWMYQNRETIPGYMKNFGEFQEQLRCGINQYYQEKVF